MTALSSYISGNPTPENMQTIADTSMEAIDKKELKKFSSFSMDISCMVGGFPAIMKRFIDHLFLPEITFKYKENSIFWNKLLKGKTARIITTLDQPSCFYRLIYQAPSTNQLKKCILQFFRISPVKITYLYTVKKSTEKQKKMVKKNNTARNQTTIELTVKIHTFKKIFISIINQSLTNLFKIEKTIIPTHLNKMP